MLKIKMNHQELIFRIFTCWMWWRIAHMTIELIEEPIMINKFFLHFSDDFEQTIGI